MVHQSQLIYDFITLVIFDRCFHLRERERERGESYARYSKDPADIFRAC